MAAGLDLSGVARALDGWLADTVLVTRDLGQDAVLDEETSELTVPEPVRVYLGPGAIQVLSDSEIDDPDTQRIVEETGATHRLLLSLSATFDGRPGDHVEVTALGPTSHDPRLLAQRWDIGRIGGATSFSVARFVYLSPTIPPEG